MEQIREILACDFIRPLDDRPYPSEEQRRLYDAIGWMYMRPADSWHAPIDKLDLGPILSGNRFCTNDQGFREALLRLVRLKHWRREVVEKAITGWRSEQQKRGGALNSCRCGRPHWLDEAQHDTTISRVMGVLHVLERMGIRDYCGLAEGRDWQVSTKPELGLPRVLSGQWDATMRFWSDSHLLLNVCVAREEPCPAAEGWDSARDPVCSIPLGLALGVSSIAARLYHSDSTVGVVVVDSDNGGVKGFWSQVHIGRIPDVALALADHFNLWRDRSEGRDRLR